MVGQTLDHHQPAAALQAADDHQRSEHPAHVGDPAQHVAWLQVERVAEIDRGLQQKSHVRVDNALGQARRPRRVDDHQRMVGIERLRWGGRFSFP